MHAVCGRDELLQVKGAVHLLRRGKIVRRGDQAQAFTLRPEQRLLHQLAALCELLLNDLERRLGARAGPGPGRRDAGLLQKEGGGGFVHAALDGARIVPHRDAKLAPGMEHAEIESDLLEAAARHEQHERTLRQMVAEAWNGEPGPGGRGQSASRKRDDKWPDSACAEGARDAAPVPLLALAEEDDL